MKRCRDQASITAGADELADVPCRANSSSRENLQARSTLSDALTSIGGRRPSRCADTGQIQ